MQLQMRCSDFNATLDKTKTAKVEDVYLTFNNVLVDWGK